MTPMVAVAPLGFMPQLPPRPRATRRAAEGEAMQDDQRMVIHNVPWETYVAITDALGERAGLRVCYCEGTLELMGPGYAHEDTKKRISRLLELYAYLSDVAIYALGSMTYRKKPRKRGAEPDECYYVGKVSKGPPHIVVEVAISRSMIDKLSLYAGLGVSELWIWEGGHLGVHLLGKSGNYREVKRSRALPDLDVEELSSFVQIADQNAAVKAYGKRLQNKG
jgi:Uma2 family endonuclease